MGEVLISDEKPGVAGVNYLGRSATTILAGGGGEVLLSS
jgi:hypothetical protein